MVQAEFNQEVGAEPFRFDGLVALPAQAVGAGLDPFERRNHLVDQVFHLSRLSGPNGLQPPAALQELVARVIEDRLIHGHSPAGGVSDYGFLAVARHAAGSNFKLCQAASSTRTA